MIIDSIELNEYIYSIKVGNNAKENWDIISGASQNDIWFHLDDASSPHIVLQTFGNKIPKRYINYIGTLFPKYKNNLLIRKIN